MIFNDSNKKTCAAKALCDYIPGDVENP